MKQEVKAIWKDIKELDSQIRTIEHQDFKEEKERDYYLVEVGLFESLGERAGDILTLDFDNIPTEKEIIKEVKEHLKNLKKEYVEKILSGREEEQLKVLCRIFKNGRYKPR